MPSTKRVRIVWSPLALERVEAIAADIAGESPAAADRWVRNVFARVMQLSSDPTSGRVVPEFNRPELRELPHPPYRLIYRVDTARVIIITVRHGRQELARFEAEVAATTPLTPVEIVE